MAVYRCILPEWAKQENPHQRRILEGEFTEEQLQEFNAQFYNIHYLPNYPSLYDNTSTVDGSHIDVFEYVFVDMDLKDGVYADKDSFILVALEAGLEPSRIIDSGNGVHVYWRVSDLSALDFLKLQRRLCRKFKTDEAVAKIFQLMRPPGYVNTKHKDRFNLCEELYASDAVYSCEDLDKFLPALTQEDDAYCKAHFDKTYNVERKNLQVDDKLPTKFGQLLHTNQEVKDIWSGNTEDRSRADYRLGHIMFASGFTKAEAASVLVNTAKALARAPVHRVAYAESIIDKIWTYEQEPYAQTMSQSVREILARGEGTVKGTRFPCSRYLDATHHGFRLGQVIGLVAGSGVGKTAMALNMFRWFVENNPDYDHFFVPLEQPANEIADRWRTLCGEDTSLHDKVHVISNYTDDGGFRHLSFEEIKQYIIEFQKSKGRKVGCVVIDHIGALKKSGPDGRQNVEDICHEMKAFAIQTNTMLVMQSQTSREKAGIGDLELNKDAAYGTVYFESYCDYLITIWQPLKRCYSEGACPTVTAFKFCKIRHKKKGLDLIQEDVPYKLMFDPLTESFRELTQDEETSFSFFLKKATNLRQEDRKTALVTYTSITWTGAPDGKTDHNSNT